MRIAALLFTATAIVAGVSTRSPAYETPVAEPGGTLARTIFVHNLSDETRAASARVRLRGSPLWGDSRERAIRGPWIEVPATTLTPGQSVEIPVEVPVPVRSPAVLAIEFRHRGGAEWAAHPFPLAFSEPADPPPPPPGGAVPFRVLGGGTVLVPIEPPEDALLPTTTSVARDASEWDALRERLGIVSPDSWGSFPTDADDPPLGFRRAEFAAPRPPDLESETLLAIRTRGTGPGSEDRRLFVRSVAERPDGTLVCRYTWRVTRARGTGYQIDGPARWLLVAIPRTDAPIVFRRVP